MRPGPLRLSLENQTDHRVLPAVWVANDTLHELIGKRKPILTAKRMLSNQTFRDVFKADNLNVDQRLKITSLTFLFTDLKGSTALYERVGDLAAFDLVRAHFHALLEIISSEKGAVVKTIGDAVMATFIRPEHAIVAGLRMRSAWPLLIASPDFPRHINPIKPHSTGMRDARRTTPIYCRHRVSPCGSGSCVRRYRVSAGRHCAAGSCRLARRRADGDRE